ncbi:MAG: HAD family hydrolase [Gammaproteobacteria bacterium]|nr:HAD family hydrolase [Gammaproteobacteria bacterium]
MKLAIFDLDNTLIAGDSDYEWGEFVVRKGLVDAEAYAAQNAAFYEDYKSGQLDIIAYQRFALAPLVGMPVEQLRALHQEFMQTVIMPLALPKALELIDSHRQAGHQLLVITATNRFITQPIVRWLGMDEMIATDPAFDAQGHILGDVVGIPSFQEGKIQRLHQWLAYKGIIPDETWFYSDSRNDLPLLQQVTHPIAVDPDEVLRDYAQAHGWSVISLREV